MTQAYPYAFNDRFINFKVHQTDFDLYSSHPVPFQGSHDSNYSQLIRKNLFGQRKPSDDQSTNLTLSSNHAIRNIDINLSTSAVNNEQKNVLSPVKILDVPNIKDDFYLNLIDWHARGPIGIALNDEAYIYTPNEISKIAKGHFNTYISSLKFNESILSVGLSNGMIEVYDVEKLSLIRTVKSHSLRVSSLAFSQNMMISGSKDKLINLNDLRIKDSLFKSISCHNGEVCTIKIKPDQRNVFASGANDNRVCIFDVRNIMPLATLKGHKGAVKAISWCPWKSNTLATGGGKNDRMIKIWNENMEVICQKQLKSQISGLEWNSKHKFLVSSHGSNSNQICVWNWKVQSGLYKINGSKNYSKRVINLIQSKQEDMVCTLSSDETMKFFEFQNVQQGNKQIYDTNRENDHFDRIL